MRSNRRVVSFGTMIARSMFSFRELAERLGACMSDPTARASRWSGIVSIAPARCLDEPLQERLDLAPVFVVFDRRDHLFDVGDDHAAGLAEDAEQLALHSFVLPFDDRLPDPLALGLRALEAGSRPLRAACRGSSRLLAVTFGRLFPFLVPAGAGAGTDCRGRIPGGEGCAC